MEKANQTNGQCQKGQCFDFARFVARWRTMLSRYLGIAFVLFYMFSDQKLQKITPLATGIMFGVGCLMVGVAVVGRLWCAEYIAGYKMKTLITFGPYSMCRNPLYFFSLLGGAGLGLCTKSVVLTLIIIAVFALVYPFTIANEERKLREIFGNAYDEYAAKVPKFLPKPSIFAEVEEHTIKQRAFRREVMDVLYFFGLVGLFQLIDHLIELGYLPVLFSIY
jgi:protein-S-isoprenylcysteine O-methyltransferase Ste14